MEDFIDAIGCPRVGIMKNNPPGAVADYEYALAWSMSETIRIDSQASKHAGCGGILAMSQDAPSYIITHEGLETLIPGAEMVCLECGAMIRSQDQVEIAV
jgi:hypothetical protein